jgi:hypothetical protein
MGSPGTRGISDWMDGLDTREERNFFLVTIIESRFLSFPALILVTAALTCAVIYWYRLAMGRSLVKAILFRY